MVINAIFLKSMEELKNCTTLGGNVNYREAMYLWGRSTWEISLASSQFCCASQIALKNVFKK